MSLNHDDFCWVRARVEHYDAEQGKVKVWVCAKFGRTFAIMDPKDVIEEPPEAKPAG